MFRRFQGKVTGVGGQSESMGFQVVNWGDALGDSGVLQVGADDFCFSSSFFLFLPGNFLLHPSGQLGLRLFLVSYPFWFIFVGPCVPVSVTAGCCVTHVCSHVSACVWLCGLARDKRFCVVRGHTYTCMFMRARACWHECTHTPCGPRAVPTAPDSSPLPQTFPFLSGVTRPL